MTPEFPPLEPAPPTMLPAPAPAPPPRWSLRDLGLLIGFGTVAIFLAYVTMTVVAVAMMSVRRGPAPSERSPEAALLSIVFM
ncbi:MAG TPA: hypothetical protein VFM21_11260, partial [Terriglobia bacterium]|nr:hypothetical protein [Terriglobia bacterium]